MELEFRNKNGTYLFTIKGLLYITMYGFLMGCADFKLTRKIFKGVEYSCFECINTAGAKTNVIEFMLSPGDYVKIKN